MTATPRRVASGPPQACFAGVGAALAFASGLFTSASEEEEQRSVLAGLVLNLAVEGWREVPSQCTARYKRVHVRY